MFSRFLDPVRIVCDRNTSEGRKRDKRLRKERRGTRNDYSACIFALLTSLFKGVSAGVLELWFPVKLISCRANCKAGPARSSQPAPNSLPLVPNSTLFISAKNNKRNSRNGNRTNMYQLPKPVLALRSRAGILLGDDVQKFRGKSSQNLVWIEEVGIFAHSS